MMLLDNLKSAQERQKKDYDLRASCKAHYVGDAVYKLDSATKIGQSRKLKTPWKGLYLVTKVINGVLFQIEDRKRSLIVHHDRLKLCNDSELPIWLQRKRSLTEETGERQATKPEEEDVLNVESLFLDTEGKTSDVPMS